MNIFQGYLRQYRLWPLALLAALPLVIFLSILFFKNQTPARALDSSQKIAIPSYFYPGPAWKQLEAAVPTVSIAIINPNSGSVNPFDPRIGGPSADYVRQVASTRAKGATVLGYVYTNYGKRSLTPDSAANGGLGDIGVEQDIDNYYKWYGVDGIFLDMASNDCSLVGYYNEIYHYIKSKGGQAKVVLNPGTETQECYMAVSDILLTFEGSYSDYTSKYSSPDWVNSYAPDRFWHLVYSAATVEEMQNAVRLSKERNTGWVYVTPEVYVDTNSNPWGSLTGGNATYWSEELKAVVS